MINLGQYCKQNIIDGHIHLFNKDGKKIKEFISREDCAKYLHLSIKDVNEAILKQTFINILN